MQSPFAFRADHFSMERTVSSSALAHRSPSSSEGKLTNVVSKTSGTVMSQPSVAASKGFSVFRSK